MKVKKLKRIRLQNYPLLFAFLLGSVLLLIFLPTLNTAAQANKQPLSPGIQNDARGKYAEPTTLVQVENPAAVVNEAKEQGVSVKEVSRIPGTPVVVEIDASPNDPVIRSLKAKLPAGTKVAPNQRYQATSHITPSDTRYGDQWNLSKIQAPAAWDITTGSSSTVLAVIDTGILFSQTVDGTTYTQPDFPADKRWSNGGEAGALASNGIDDDGNGFVDDWQGWDFMGGYSGDSDCPNHAPGSPAETYFGEDNDPQPYSCDSPSHPTELNKTHYNGTCVAFESACYVGHGTLVGSAAGAKTNNNALIAGVDHHVSLMNVRVLDGYGFTDTSIVTQAVRYATANGADVINLSLATTNCDGTSSDPILEDALADAEAAGVVVAAAAGNGGTNNICYPASSPHTIAVGATNQDDQKASFSNTGSSLDIVAPGVNIPTANAPSNASPSEYYPSANGTSLSAPHVAGLATLIKAVDSAFTPAQVKLIITGGATKVSGMGGNNYTTSYGYGRINAYASLRLTSLTHPDGTLVQAIGDPKVYLIENGEKRHVASRQVFDSHHFHWGYVRKTVPRDMDLPVSTPLSFREGTLLQSDSDPVYIVDYDGVQLTKRHITSPEVFNGLGFSFTEVIKVADSNLPAINGPAVSSASHHPDGTLVQTSGDPKVYLLEDGERRHVSSREVLYSYGFSFSRIKTATAGDKSLPVVAALDFREGTLLQGSSDPVYAINYDGATIEKRHVAARVVFDLLSFRFDQVVKVSDSQLPPVTGTPIQ